jgi:hypothetical protein
MIVIFRLNVEGKSKAEHSLVSSLGYVHSFILFLFTGPLDSTHFAARPVHSNPTARPIIWLPFPSTDIHPQNCNCGVYLNVGTPATYKVTNPKRPNLLIHRRNCILAVNIFNVKSFFAYYFYRIEKAVMQAFYFSKKYQNSEIKEL